MNAAIRIIPALILASMCLPAKAEIYRISPGSALAMGEGFDPRQPRRVFLPCIKHEGIWGTTTLDPGKKPKPGEEYKTSAGFSFQSSEIETRKQLYEFVSISASVSGGYGFYSGSASFLSEDEYKFDEYSYHFALRATTEFGDFRLINPTLNADAQVALYRSPSAFFERCGTEFVGQQTRGASVAVVYSIYSLDTSTRSLVEASLKASFDSGVADVGGQGKFKEILQEALRTGTLRVHVYGYGGKGVSDLSGLVKNSTDVAKVKEEIAAYVKNLDIDSSVPIAYATGNMTSLEPRLGTVDFGIFNRTLSEYLFVWEDLNGYRNTLQRLLRSHAAHRFTVSERTRYEELFNTAGSLADGIVTKALQCRDQLNTQVAALKLESRPTPSKATSLKCPALTSAESAFSLPRLPNPQPFTVEYVTGEYGVDPKSYLALTVEGTGLQEANLVGGFSGLTKQHSGVIEVLKVDQLSTGGNRIRANFDLAKLREKAPVAIAIKLTDGFTEFYELTLPSIASISSTATLSNGIQAIDAPQEAQVSIQKVSDVSKQVLIQQKAKSNLQRRQPSS